VHTDRKRKAQNPLVPWQLFKKRRDGSKTEGKKYWVKTCERWKREARRRRETHNVKPPPAVTPPTQNKGCYLADTRGGGGYKKKEGAGPQLGGLGKKTAPGSQKKTA